MIDVKISKRRPEEVAADLIRKHPKHRVILANHHYALVGTAPNFVVVSFFSLTTELRYQACASLGRVNGPAQLIICLK